jgi:hypothetical protein
MSREQPMTETQWLESAHPFAMLRFLRNRPSERKWRLFAVACVARFATVDPQIERLVRIIELYADGGTGWNELSSVRKALKELVRQAMQRNMAVGAGALQSVEAAAHPSAGTAAEWALRHVVGESGARFVRDLFGNPFREFRIDPAWLTFNDNTIDRLAQAIYDEHAFEDLPILADALEDAGCTDTTILDHCRGPGPHVRGCWVVDHLLRKE